MFPWLFRLACPDSPYLGCEHKFAKRVTEGMKEEDKVCCCLDVMVRKDRGDFGDGLDWRQLDDDEMSTVFADDGRWLKRYRRREWHDELEALPAVPEDPVEDDVDVPAPAPFEVLESGRALRDALIHHFKRFKAHLREIRPAQHQPLRRLQIH